MAKRSIEELKMETMVIDNRKDSVYNNIITGVSVMETNLEDIELAKRLPKVKWVRHAKDAIVPTKTKYNAGFDIYTTESSYVLMPNETHMFPTDISSIIEDGYYFQIFERGSTGSKGIAQRCGVIDTNYSGIWFIPVTNTTNKPIIFTKGTSRRNDVEEMQHVEEYFRRTVLTSEQRSFYLLNQSLYTEAFNDYFKDVIIYRTDKAIAQAVLLPCYDVDSSEGTLEDLEARKEELASKGDTRGAGALGSSGK